MTDHHNALGQPVGAPLPMAFPRQRPPTTAMPGRYCSVIPTDVAAHATGLFDALRADGEGRNWTYLPYGPFDTLAELRNWMQATCTGPDPLFHTIVDTAGRPLGLASYLRIDPATAVIEVAHIHLSPALQRTAAATEAMFLMMARVFDDMGYRRYEWKCDALNAPSRRAARRLGFTYEGTFRKATHYKGRNRDTAWFSVTDDEWPALGSMFRQWLSADNFTAEGQQVRPLDAMRSIVTGPEPD
jgi:RimJ/RimL family protein N-acetyltransferase